MKKKTIKQEFLENRTSWKFLEGKLEKLNEHEHGDMRYAIIGQILLEILKEIQYKNS
jgi:hypothetical protein